MKLQMRALNKVFFMARSQVRSGLYLWSWLLFFVMQCSVKVHGQAFSYLPLGDTTLIQISSFHEGLAKIETRSAAIGYIDTTGRYRIGPDPAFEQAGSFHNGRAWVQQKTTGNGLYGFIDQSGKIVIECKYSRVKDFSQNRAAVYSNKDGWQLIDPTGQVILGDTALFAELSGDQGDGVGQTVDLELPDYQDGLMLVRRGGKYGYLDTSGGLFIACKYLKATSFSSGIAMVAKDTVERPLSDTAGDLSILEKLYNSLPSGPPEYQWLLIDTTGKEICSIDATLSADNTGGFSESLMAFKSTNGKWGFINTKGEIAISARFRDKPSRFSDGVCIVQIQGKQSGNKDGYMLLVDTAGNQVSKIPFCTVHGCMYDSRLAYHDGLLAVKIGNDWGYMDKAGKLVVEPQFNTALDFHNGRAVVLTKNGQLKVLEFHRKM